MALPQAINAPKQSAEMVSGRQEGIRAIWRAVKKGIWQARMLMRSLTGAGTRGTEGVEDGAAGSPRHRNLNLFIKILHKVPIV